MSRTKADRPVSAWAVQAAREFIGQSREELAADLTVRTQEPWSYQSVFRIESGKRRIEPELLAVIAEIQGFPLSWYVTEPRSRTAWFGSLLPATPAATAV